MRKQIKSILSMVLSAAMVLTLGSGISIDGTKSAAAADAEAGTAISTPFNVVLRQNNSVVFNSYYQTITEDPLNDGDDNVAMDVATMAAITVTGDYSIGAEATENVDDLADEATAIWLATDLKSVPTDFSVIPKTITITRWNGEVDQYDWSKACLYHNGLKETDEVRIGVTNAYASTKTDEYGYANPLKSNINGTWASDNPIAIEAGDYISFDFSVTADAPVITPSPVPTATPTAPPAKSSYNAYFAFQTDTYVFRNAWDDSGYGLNGVGDKNGKLDNYKTQIGYWNGTSLAKATAKLTDVEMTDNGTYTVSMSGVNLQTLKGTAAGATASTCFNALFVSTDIPVAMKGVTATATLKIDGKTIKSNFAIPASAEADYYEFYLSDAYSDTHGTEKTVAYPKDSLLKVLPTSSVEITFTLKGADFSGKDYGTKTVGLAKGKTFTKGNFKYKVTTASTETLGKKTAGKVQLVGLSAAGKKKTSVSVPAKVTKGSATYKITAMKASAFAKATKLKKITFKKATNLKALSKKAFYKATKLQTVVLNKKMKKLPANAFGGCKKLKTLTINAKLSSVNKKAFTGCKKKITIKGTSKKANLKKIKKVYKKAK